MKKLFEVANRYIETSDWKIIAVLKFCLISLGMIAQETDFHRFIVCFHRFLYSADGQVLPGFYRFRGAVK